MIDLKAAAMAKNDLNGKDVFGRRVVIQYADLHHPPTLVPSVACTSDSSEVVIPGLCLFNVGLSTFFFFSVC